MGYYNVDKILNEISVNSNVDLSIVKQQYDNYIKDGKSELQAIISLKKSIGVRVSHDYKPYKFYVIAVLKEPTNIFDRMREKALREYQKNPKMAEAQGYVSVVDGNITPLDYRKTLYGKSNKNYGHPLLGNLWISQYLVMIRNEEWKEVAIVDMRNKVSDKVYLELGHEYEGWIKIIESDSNQFNYARISNGDLKDLGSKIYYLDDIREFLNPYIYDWTDSDLLRIENVDKYGMMIGYMKNLRTTKNGKLYFTMSSIEYFLDWDYFVFPRTFEIPVMEGTAMIIIGKFKYDPDRNSHSISAYGIIPLKDAYYPLTQDRLALEEAKNTTPF